MIRLQFRQLPVIAQLRSEIQQYSTLLLSQSVFEGIVIFGVHALCFRRLLGTSSVSLWILGVHKPLKALKRRVQLMVNRTACEVCGGP